RGTKCISQSGVHHPREIGEVGVERYTSSNDKLRPERGNSLVEEGTPNNKMEQSVVRHWEKRRFPMSSSKSWIEQSIFKKETLRENHLLQDLGCNPGGSHATYGAERRLETLDSVLPEERLFVM
ncbi:hypothetical protein TNIN_158781, partial [Trichonephila inaurata madagascariensis]